MTEIDTDLRDEIERIKGTLATLTDSIDLLHGIYTRHQHHHEAVEELMGRPVMREVIRNLLHDIEVMDSKRREEERDKQKTVLNPEYIRPWRP
jgi:hypothetical protein